MTDPAAAYLPPFSISNASFRVPEAAVIVNDKGDMEPRRRKLTLVLTSSCSRCERQAAGRGRLWLAYIYIFEKQYVTPKNNSNSWVIIVKYMLPKVTLLFLPLLSWGAYEGGTDGGGEGGR